MSDNTFVRVQLSQKSASLARRSPYNDVMRCSLSSWHVQTHDRSVTAVVIARQTTRSPPTGVRSATRAVPSCPPPQSRPLVASRPSVRLLSSARHGQHPALQWPGAAAAIFSEPGRTPLTPAVTGRSSSASDTRCGAGWPTNAARPRQMAR